MRGDGRRSGAAVGVVAVATVIGGLVYALLPPMATRHVEIPPDDASPRTVARAFMDALDAHDCRAADQLTVATGSARADTDLWCGRVGSLRFVSFSGGSPTPPGQSGLPRTAEVYDLGVTFDLP